MDIPGMDMGDDDEDYEEPEQVHALSNSCRHQQLLPPCVR